MRIKGCPAALWARVALGSRRRRTDEARYSHRSVTAFRRDSKTRWKRRLTTPMLEKPHGGQPMEQIATKPQRPRVVIVGAGFGGLAAAKRLAKGPLDVTIIDRRNYHLFQPLPYQVATARFPPRTSPGRSAASSPGTRTSGSCSQLFSHRRASADDRRRAMVLGLPHPRQGHPAHRRAGAVFRRSEDAGLV